jgi:hypothetical protein
MVAGETVRDVDVAENIVLLPRPGSDININT